MFRTLRDIVTALLATLTRRHPQATNSVPTSASHVGGDSIVNPVLMKLLEHHGVPVKRDGDWLTIEKGLRMAGAVVREFPSPRGSASIQIDMYVELSDGRLLIESFGGLGASKEDAIKDGLYNFMRNSFHVLLSSLLNRSAEGQVEIEEWTVGGTKRRVTIGGMGIRSSSSEPFDPPTHWFPIVQNAIESSDLPSGTHWFRCYYAQIDSKPLAIEALLDNDDWTQVIETMSEIEWPRTRDFYSVRVFAVIQDGG